VRRLREREREKGLGRRRNGCQREAIYPPPVVVGSIELSKELLGFKKRREELGGGGGRNGVEPTHIVTQSVSVCVAIKSRKGCAKNEKNNVCRIDPLFLKIVTISLLGIASRWWCLKPIFVVSLRPLFFCWRKFDFA
jgi:hypothetical protein